MNKEIYKNKKLYAYLVIVCIVLISNNCFSQTLVRGYSPSISYGFLDNSDKLSLICGSNQYDLQIGDASAYAYSMGFPIDFGYSRHRFSIIPGIELNQSSYLIEGTNAIEELDNLRDEVKIRTNMIMPHFSFAYKYNFILAKQHFALVLGVSARLPISYTYDILDRNSSSLIDNELVNDYIFYENTVFAKEYNFDDFMTNPFIGLDIFLSRYFILNIFTYYTNMSANFTDEIVGVYAGAGVTYMVKWGRDDRTQVFQYYKNR